MSQPTFDLDLDDGGLPTLTVRELAEAINGARRRGFFEGVWVRGEIQGLSERNGHLYFSLADDGDEGKATIAVSLFANVRFDSPAAPPAPPATAGRRPQGPHPRLPRPLWADRAPQPER